MFVFVLFVSSCVSLVAVRKKMGYGLVKPESSAVVLFM